MCQVDVHLSSFKGSSDKCQNDFDLYWGFNIAFFGLCRLNIPPLANSVYMSLPVSELMRWVVKQCSLSFLALRTWILLRTAHNKDPKMSCGLVTEVGSFMVNFFQTVSWGCLQWRKAWKFQNEHMITTSHIHGNSLWAKQLRWNFENGGTSAKRGITLEKIACCACC